MDFLVNLLNLLNLDFLVNLDMLSFLIFIFVGNVRHICSARVCYQ